MVLIYPPIPMTYELMLWPIEFHAVVQFFMTFAIAGALIDAVHSYRKWQTGGE